MEKLSIRLQTIAKQVSAGKRLADIGCDHGFVPIALVQSGQIPSAIAMDVRTGPLSRAKEHIEQAGLNQQISTRLSDGLEKLEPGEADSILIAGMGGALTIRILRAGMDVVRAADELILEPQSELGMVRAFLKEQDLLIESEELVCEDGKFYPILKVDPKKRWSDHGVEESLAILYGPCLIKKRSPVLRQYLEKERQTKLQILAGLDASEKKERTQKRREELENLLKKNEQALSAW